MYKLLKQQFKILIYTILILMSIFDDEMTSICLCQIIRQSDNIQHIIIQSDLIIMHETSPEKNRAAIHEQFMLQDYFMYNKTNIYRLVPEQPSMLSTLIKIHKETPSQIDLVCQYVVQMPMMELITGYDCVSNIEEMLKKYKSNDVLGRIKEIVVIGIKRKTVEMGVFMELLKGRMRDRSKRGKVGELRKNRTMEYRTKWLNSKYGANETAVIKQSKEKPVKEKEKRAQQKGSDVFSKRHLRLVSGSEDSHTPMEVDKFRQKMRNTKRKQMKVRNQEQQFKQKQQQQYKQQQKLSRYQKLMPPQKQPQKPNGKSVYIQKNRAIEDEGDASISNDILQNLNPHPVSSQGLSKQSSIQNIKIKIDAFSYITQQNKQNDRDRLKQKVEEKSLHKPYKKKADQTKNKAPKNNMSILQFMKKI